MAYSIIISPRTQKEIENAIDYYALYSKDSSKNFIEVLKNAYTFLEQTPFQNRVHYKNIRALKLKKFPYSLFYIANEEKQVIKILSCFHNKRNPQNRPRY